MVSAFAVDESKVKNNIDPEQYNNVIKVNLSEFRKFTREIILSKIFIKYFINDNLDNYITDAKKEEIENRIKEKKQFDYLFKYSCKDIETCKIILLSNGKCLNL